MAVNSQLEADSVGPRTAQPVMTPSKKVLRTIYRQGWLNVWEGAVRSSKTLTSTIAWLYYISQSDDVYFLMTGKTLGSLLRNVYDGDMGLKAMVPEAHLRHNLSSTTIIIPTPKGNKVCYCFGGGNSNSHEPLVGLTVGGWYADEISEHHPRFIQECFNRTVVSTDRRHFWTLNPQTPKHFIYTDYLDKYDAWTKEENRKAGGYYWHHFTLHDNPALTEEMIAMLSKQFIGYAYQRYILGLRVIAEGLVYANVRPEHFKDFDRERCDVRYCAIDFGTTHATVMYFGGPYDGDRTDWRICYEVYDQASGKDTDDYVRLYEETCKKYRLDAKHIQIAIDPAAGPLKNSFRKYGYSVFNAKNEVLSGILYCQRYINQGHLSFHKSCKNLDREFGTYHWDEKATERGEDRVIKMDDDCVDAMRYFVMSHMKYLIG